MFTNKMLSMRTHMRFDNNIRKAHAHQKRIKKSYENLEENFVYSALN